MCCLLFAVFFLLFAVCCLLIAPCHLYYAKCAHLYEATCANAHVGANFRMSRFLGCHNFSELPGTHEFFGCRLVSRYHDFLEFPGTLEFSKCPFLLICKFFPEFPGTPNFFKRPGFSEYHGFPQFRTHVGGLKFWKNASLKHTHLLDVFGVHPRIPRIQRKRCQEPQIRPPKPRAGVLR